MSVLKAKKNISILIINKNKAVHVIPQQRVLLVLLKKDLFKKII